MVNKSKAKGDAGEREAVVALLLRTPHLLVQDRRPMRELGAGRKDDEGDLRVLPGTSIQVKTWASLVRACREAADGAVRQGRNAGSRFAFGMVPVPRARKELGALRWLAVGYSWPGGTDQWEPVPTFGTTAAAVKHLQTGFGGRVPLRLRMARVRAKGTKTMYVAPLEAWLECYAEATDQPYEVPAGYVPPWAGDAETAEALGEGSRAA